MLKTTIAAGIATTALFAGFLGSTAAHATARPSVDVSSNQVASTAEVDYTMSNVLEGCTVRASLGKQSSTSSDADVSGDAVGSIAAPKYAGVYTLTARVSNNCDEHAGNTDTVKVQVGDQVSTVSHKARDISKTGLATRVTGTLGVDDVATDLGSTRVTATINGAVVARFKTNSDGKFAFAVPSTAFANGAGTYRVVLSTTANTLYFIKNESFTIRVVD